MTEVVNTRVNIPEVIILHHSLTSDGVLLKDFDSIKRYHTKVYGWSDIGYHWVLESVDGKLQWIKGREENVPGAHCKEQSMNFRSIGLCVVGDYDNETLSEEHYEMIKVKVLEIRGRYQKGLPLEGHRKYATYKSCPGLNVTMSKVEEYIQSHRIHPDLKYLQEHKPPIFDDVEYWNDLINQNAMMKDVRVEYFVAAVRKIVERD